MKDVHCPMYKKRIKRKSKVQKKKKKRRRTGERWRKKKRERMEKNKISFLFNIYENLTLGFCWSKM